MEHEIRSPLRRTTPPARAALALALAAAVVVALLLWRPAGLYPWLKAAHVIAIIAWMAGLLYLPRLFVYHCDAERGSQQSATFKLMERRLLTIILNPAMVASWALGLWLAIEGGLYRAGWFQAKVVLVLMLSGLHGFLARWVRLFAADANPHSPKFYRIINEVPTLLMFGIVVLAIVKPF
jgi:putative membrane protein